MFLCAGDEGPWTGQRAFLIGYEAILCGIATDLLRCLFQRDIGQVPGGVQRLSWSLEWELLRGCWPQRDKRSGSSITCCWGILSREALHCRHLCRKAPYLFCVVMHKSL